MVAAGGWHKAVTALLSIVVPVFNEESVLDAFHSRLTAVLEDI
ncbi:MAG: hypothetical protein AAF640_01060, partial [Pseudomonadota bacterium]